MPVKQIFIICGPTSSGKTDLALRLAKNEPASIISADSRQVYLGLDILTGKDIPAGFTKNNSDLTFNDRPVAYYEKNNLRIWGLDLLFPNEEFNAAEFSSLSHRMISRESGKDRTIFIVGGTGFYLKSLVDPAGLANVAPDKTLRLSLDDLPVDDLQQKLSQINSKKFNSLNDSDRNNPRRLIRAIEISLHPETKQKTKSPQTEQFVFTWIGIRVPLDVIKENIQKRIDTRLASGAVDEVKDLLQKYPDRTLPVYTTLGVKPVTAFIEGELNEPQMKAQWLRDEIAYAKRQLTWFKKQAQIIWYD